jgi:hypothetical protein
MKKLYLFALLLTTSGAFAQTDALKAQVAKKADALQPQLVTWRRDFHEHPELGNHEVRTAGIIV